MRLLLGVGLFIFGYVINLLIRKYNTNDNSLNNGYQDKNFSKFVESLKKATEGDKEDSK
jgi:hypothetical protein